MLVHVPLQVPSPFVTVQSALLEQNTVFTHSDGSEFGDCEGYEHTSMSAAVDGRSAVTTQHCAWVSFVRQLEPAHLLAFRVSAAKGSATRSFTVQLDEIIVFSVAPVQLNCFVSLQA